MVIQQPGRAVMRQADNRDYAPRHLMLLPSLACQARCSYCFGPNRGPVMRDDIFDAALNWIAATTPTDQSLELTFHGGEPLLAGHAWYHRNLPRLHQRFGDGLRLGIQSNLWLLDDEFCELFREHRVSIGTSLDGPEAINDAQRGAGYFAHTMAGIETARRHGLSPGVICTFTRRSAPHYQEIFDFFAEQGLGFSVHAMVCGLDGAQDDGLALTAEEKGDLLVALFDCYLANVTRARIGTFDSMARSISAGHGGLCTFTDCLGGYLTVAPDGGIFSCNRFAHHPEWRLGWVHEQPGLDTLTEGPVWQALRARELSVAEDCGDCAHFAYCRGGCAYNAFAAASPVVEAYRLTSTSPAEAGCPTCPSAFQRTSDVSAGHLNDRRPDRRDPHCEAYRRLFSHIGDRALAEVFSEDNLAAVVKHGPNGHGLMQRGSLLQIMRGSPHPQKVAARARETVACVALAASASPEEALQKLTAAGAITEPARALASLTALHERLHTPPKGLVNAYLHVTYACNLACSHCYAASGPLQGGPVMAAAEMAALVQQAAAAGFSKIVITGGEPLAHPQRDTLLDALAELRPAVKPAQLVLRTNLALPLPDPLLIRLAAAVNWVVVSVDGDAGGHDARRGPGAYARTVANLQRLLRLTRRTSPVSTLCRVQLAATPSAAETTGAAGEAVRALGRELDVPVRFKPVLPLGRALDHGMAPENYSSLDDDAEAVACAPAPRATCGLGMNLYIGPGGKCFPCYALTGARHDLGNVLAEGLTAVLARNDAYRRVTVDSSRRCGCCALRYLCGGACRAWSDDSDPNAGPVNCAALYAAARERLLSALSSLKISSERWLAAGLPLPDETIS